MIFSKWDLDDRSIFLIASSDLSLLKQTLANKPRTSVLGLFAPPLVCYFGNQNLQSVLGFVGGLYKSGLPVNRTSAIREKLSV
jgi:hypothetical protein